MLPESTTASLHEQLEMQPLRQVRRQTWNRGKPKFVTEAVGAIVAMLKKAGFTKAAKAIGTSGKATDDFTAWIDVDGNNTELRVLVGVAVRDAAATRAQLFDIAASDIPEPDREQVRIRTTGVPDAVALMMKRLATADDALSADEVHPPATSKTADTDRA